MLTFTKDERLCSKVLIDKLVVEGKSFNSGPYRLIWRKIEVSSSKIKIVISVPKRTFKRAVDRNKLKRRIREAYRKNKTKLYDQLKEQNILLMIIYTDKAILEYKEIEIKIIVAMERLSKTINP